MIWWANSVLVLGVSWMHDSTPPTRCYVRIMLQTVLRIQ